MNCWPPCTCFFLFVFCLVPFLELARRETPPLGALKQEETSGPHISPTCSMVHVAFSSGPLSGILVWLRSPVPFYRFFFVGGFPYKNRPQKKQKKEKTIVYPYSNLSNLEDLVGVIRKTLEDVPVKLFLWDWPAGHVNIRPTPKASSAEARKGALHLLKSCLAFSWGAEASIWLKAFFHFPLGNRFHYWIFPEE